MPIPDPARHVRRFAFVLLLAAQGALAAPPTDAPVPPLSTPTAGAMSGQPVPGADAGRIATSSAPPVATDAASRVSTTEAPRIGLVTVEPGSEYWSRFGHNAILVDDGIAPMLYNYGFFDFQQPGFLTRFLRGRMLYRLMALPLEDDLRGYAADGRGIELQWLAVEPAAAVELAEFLRWNALPENADYRYDYFTANCSTKVRDALDSAFGGALRRELSGRSHGYTFRDEARRLAATLPWMYLGIHLGLGPFTDRPLSLWDESFVPMRLRDALDETRIAGRPVVTERRTLLPHALGPTPDSPPEWRSWFALAGLSAALLLAMALRPSAPRALRVVGSIAAAGFWLASSLAGLGLLALWVLTDHLAAWGNENALLFNPFCLGLLAALPAMQRGTAAGRGVARLSLFVAVCAGIALFLKFLPFRLQANGDWIALMLPLHAMLALRLAGPPATR